MPETSPSLHDLQRWLADVVLRPESEREGGVVAPPERGTTDERLHAYIDGYPARLREALTEGFPAVAHLVGAWSFAELVRRHLPSVPGGTYNLSDTGRNLPTFLEGDALTSEYPFLPDLARLEWVVQHAFHAHLEAPFDASTVAGWSPDDWADARIRFQPGTTVVESEWPVRTLWSVRETPIEEIDVGVEGHPETVIVHRDSHSVVCDVIEPGEAAVLRRLLSGDTLAEATADLSPDDAESLGAWTASWVQRGIVTACER